MARIKIKDKRFDRFEEDIVFYMSGILWTLGRSAYFIPSSNGEIEGHVFSFMHGLSPVEVNNDWNNKSFTEILGNMVDRFESKTRTRLIKEMTKHYANLVKISSEKDLMNSTPPPRWESHWITKAEVDAILTANV